MVINVYSDKLYTMKKKILDYWIKTLIAFPYIWFFFVLPILFSLWVFIHSFESGQFDITSFNSEELYFILKIAALYIFVAISGFMALKYGKLVQHLENPTIKQKFLFILFSIPIMIVLLILIIPFGFFI